MTVAITREAKSLNDVVLDALNGAGQDRPQTFWTEGDSSTVTFAVTKGFYPYQVFVNGALMRNGSGEDYIVTHDGFTYSITFAVAPAAVDIGFICWRAL